MFLSDPSDACLDDFRNIRDADLIRRRGLFVAEGRLVVGRLLASSRLAARAVMLTEVAREALADFDSARPDVPVYVVPQAVMDQVAGFNIHRGCLALGEYPPPRPWQEVVAGSRTILVLERVTNADNVGSIFRSAAAFGVGAVRLDDTTTDPLYRKAIRTSMGATLAVPFARVTAWPAKMSALRELGFASVALTPAASAATIDTVVAAVGERPVALILGHEGEGLSETTLAACEFRARIPTTSNVDSLNVAAAATIALYALSRAR